ncbi:hypothetical protein [Holdemania massiliensis]|uniref:hypothetical protein n=1 Tax=Holdemania massiliensis TaxID=1468449 RepID=UPI001F067082|nr:hypothetical protein [Holdemania massiliensis]MCH1939502.1 hypothetical protein [Holdemania massiliensis]
MNRGCLISLAALITSFGLLTAHLWPTLLWAHHSAGMACLTGQIALIVFLLYRHE